MSKQLTIKPNETETAIKTNEPQEVQAFDCPEYLSQKENMLLQFFTQKLNKEPDSKEFQKTPDGKAFSIPISFIEMTLDEIFFGQWSTENFKWSVVTNEVQGSIDLVIVHPVTGKELRRTGAASIIIMVDKAPDEIQGQERNQWALNPSNKKSNALDLGFPKLKAECLKNAAQSLGKIFGRDINRKHKDNFSPTLVAINEDAFQAAIKQIEEGRIGVIEKITSHFIVTPEQVSILANVKPLKQLI